MTDNPLNHTDISTFLLSAKAWGLISIPIISALIGWVTNYVAVKMIFRPQKPFRFLGMTLQGLVPRRQRELALSIGEVVERELVSHADVQRAMENPELREKLAAQIEREIDTFMQQRLQNNPLIAMFLPGDLAQNIKRMLREQLEGNIPNMLALTVGELEKHLDFQKVVQQKIEQFDLTKLEEIIYRISSKELKAIEYLGGVLGFIIGLGQVAVMVWTA